ncbi:MAG TPA: polyphosphate kinase 2 family protein [Propionibacteriaceae bacterium]|jgi:PPK2 family polyphosphate:nucleotide phosphotransferase
MASHDIFAGESRRLTDLLRVLPGSTVDLSSYDTRATSGYAGHGKKDAEALRLAMGVELADLQERLFADGRSFPERATSVLVVLQGMDTSGKGGTVSHVFSLMNPAGIEHTAFKVPTPEERKHDFLWRITNALPEKGMIGIFDRSHYEDVLVVRVENLVLEDVWGARYDQINDWEATLADSGTRIIKCFLHISPEAQKARLGARLADPSKYWKYNPGDIDVRAKWDEYRKAYEAVLSKCSTDVAPWYVIPSDRKWYRNWAVATLVHETLLSIDPVWPPATFDVATEKARVAGS